MSVPAWLHNSHVVLKALMDHAPSGMALVSPSGECLRANRALAHMLGYAEADFIGRHYTRFTHPDDVVQSDSVYARLRANDQQPLTSEKRYLRRDGSYMWGHAVWSAVRDGQGAVLYIIVQIIDISARKQHEEALQDLAQYLQLAIDASGIGIWSHDYASRRTQIDARVHELWARPPGARDGDRASWYAQIHPDDREEAIRVYEKTLLDATAIRLQHRIILPDGGIRHIRVQTAIERHPDGRPRKLIGSNWDVTSEVEAAEVMERAKAEAEAANKAKSQFLANMSHELRTPLNAIIGFSDAMKSRIVDIASPDLVQAYCTDIHNSGQHLLSIINDLLDLSRIEAGRFETHEETLHFYDVIADAAVLMRKQIADAGLTLAYDFDGSAPDILADERALRQILLNLISNAVKFTRPGGRVTLGLRATHGDGLRFWVADTGIGIPAHHIPRLMKPFAQVDNVYAREHQGAGLGLAIVRSLAALHNGEITIDSQPNHGTTVTVALPPARVIALRQATALA